MKRFVGAVVRWTLGRAVREALGYALDAKALSYQIMRETERQPETHDLALRLERPLTWLCRVLEQGVAGSRVTSGPEERVQLELPFATR